MHETYVLSAWRSSACSPILGSWARPQAHHVLALIRVAVTRKLQKAQSTGSLQYKGPAAQHGLAAHSNVHVHDC